MTIESLNLINGFNFFLMHFLKKTLYKALWPKQSFLSENSNSLLDIKVKLRPKFLGTSFINSHSFNKICMLHLGYFHCQSKSAIFYTLGAGAELF